jgi:hypothetical protein
MDFDAFRQNRLSRDELQTSIDTALRQLNDKELEAVYYDLLTKDYIKS